MDLTRKIGTAIVMLVPAFVLGGLVWELIPSWFSVLGIEIVVVLAYVALIQGKFPSLKRV